MPSGPKRRKAAKKKQAKQSNNSNSSSTTHSHHGESDGGELLSPAAHDQHNHQVPFTDKNEPNLYQNESITVEGSEKAGKEEEGSTEIDDKGSKLSKKSHNSSSSSISSSVDDESNAFEKKSVELESTPVVESVHSIESKIVHEVKDSDVETSAVVDPIKPADSVLEAESHVENGTQIEKLVPKSLFSEQMLVVNESASKDKCSSSASSEVVEFVVVENGAPKLPSLEENASLEARDDDEVAVSSHPMGAVSGVNGADCVNEPETSQYSDKQPLIASAPRAVQTTSWKGCCGILELFSSSDRN